MTETQFSSLLFQGAESELGTLSSTWLKFLYPQALFNLMFLDGVPEDWRRTVFLLLLGFSTYPNKELPPTGIRLGKSELRNFPVSPDRFEAILASLAPFLTFARDTKGFDVEIHPDEIAPIPSSRASAKATAFHISNIMRILGAIPKKH